jgi:uncharacterized protein YkwD
MVVLAGTLLVASTGFAREDIGGLIDSLRIRDCPHPLARAQTLQASARLDAAAEQVLQGASIEDALKRANFRAKRSAGIQISGDVDDAALPRMLGKSYCHTITDPELTAIGTARGATGIAIVLAAPFMPPAATDENEISREVLQLVNEARASPRRCGNERFTAAPPLIMNDKLNAAAAIQARDMAARGSMSHRGSDDSKPPDRVTRVGYAWSAVAENVAVGQGTPSAAVAAWLSSRGHCANIMNPDYTEMGVAFASNPTQAIGVYWAQVFGRRR